MIGFRRKKRVVLTELSIQVNSGEGGALETIKTAIRLARAHGHPPHGATVNFVIWGTPLRVDALSNADDVYRLWTTHPEMAQG